VYIVSVSRKNVLSGVSRKLNGSCQLLSSLGEIAIWDCSGIFTTTYLFRISGRQKTHNNCSSEEAPAEGPATSTAGTHQLQSISCHSRRARAREFGKTVVYIILSDRRTKCCNDLHFSISIFITHHLLKRIGRRGYALNCDVKCTSQ